MPQLRDLGILEAMNTNLEIQNQLDMPNAAYATSRATANWLTKRMNGEERGPLLR
jgi:hypothetical protein